VETIFSAEEWKSLSRDQRVARCVGYASEATGLADLATHPDLKERYLAIAGQWLNLADEVQRSAGE